jgi:hypothetical protein
MSDYTEPMFLMFKIMLVGTLVIGIIIGVVVVAVVLA